MSIFAGIALACSVVLSIACVAHAWASHQAATRALQSARKAEISAANACRARTRCRHDADVAHLIAMSAHQGREIANLNRVISRRYL